MRHKINLEHVAIVLQQPRYPENIGSVARAMCNMGLKDLIVVSPENWDIERVNRLATHAASTVVESLKIETDLQAALAPFHHVVGTTARLGGQRQGIVTLSKMAEHLIPISQNNRVALLFGPEDRGLTNIDIRRCHRLLTIPTAEFSSLNLAQAVMVVCYELFINSRDPGKAFHPRLATRHELDGMYAQLKEILINISYIQPDNPDYWMQKLREFGTRMALRAREVSIIRGVCRQIEWYAQKRYRDGLKAGSGDPGGEKGR